MVIRAFFFFYIWKKWKKKYTYKQHVEYSVEKNAYFYCAVDVGIPLWLQANDLWGEGDRRGWDRRKVAAACVELKLEINQINFGNWQLASKQMEICRCGKE